MFPGWSVRILSLLAISLFLPTPLLAEETPQGTDVSGQNFFEILFSGGIVGFLILFVLLALSLFASYLAFEQTMALRTKVLIPEGLSEAVKQALLAKNLQEANQVCRNQPSFLGFVVSNGLQEIDGGWASVEKGVEDTLADQAAGLFRRIEYLSVIGNIAPMVGLLGTVTGMIFAFQEVASSPEEAGAAQLAEGIYMALVTTVGGLLVAIPSLGAFAIFRNRVDQLTAETAYAAVHALTPLKRRTSRSSLVRAEGRPEPGNPQQGTNHPRASRPEKD